MHLPHKNAARYTALVIDDEEISRELARIALEQIGFSDISVVGDGAMALLAMDRMHRQPDYVICDIFMPQSDGIELVNALAQRHYGGGLVLVSGGDSQFLVIAKRVARFHGLNLLGSLTKPIRTEALAEALFGPEDAAEPEPDKA
jgi:CheY-like chemotaxis protein